MSQDIEFEKYLQGKSGLTQLYADLPEAALPAHLDAAILAEAHRAVNAHPGAKPGRRWVFPLSMVATLFVVVMVGLQLPFILKDAASPQQYKEDRTAAMMDNSTAERTFAAPEEARKKQLTGQLLAKSKSDSTRGEPAIIAAEADAPAKANAPMLAAPKESTTPESKQFGVTSLVASPSPQPAPARAAKRHELRESEVVDSGDVLAKERKPSGHAGMVSESFEQRAPASARMAAPQAAQPENSLKDETSAADLRPKDWLLRIKRLKQEGRLDEAKKNLAAFKKRYPDYPVPVALEFLK